MARLLTDIRPLKESADFRRLWIGSTVSQLGQQMTAVTVSIQVYALTHSMLLVAQSELHWNRVWVLYAVVAVQSACFAVNNPARSAIIPRLVRPELLPAANTLSQAAFNLGFTAGPLLGAVVIAWQGFGAAYLVDVITFTAALYALFRLPRSRRPAWYAEPACALYWRASPSSEPVRRCWRPSSRTSSRWSSPNHGRCSRPVAGAFFAGGVRTVGLLQAAPAIGALVGVLFSGWVGRVRRQGVAIVAAITVYAVAVGLFGLSRTIWLGVALLALSGAADMVSSAYRNTVLQSAAPDAMRGRLQGVFIVEVAGGPRLGDFVAGTTASLSTPTIALLAGAGVCVIGLLILLAWNKPFRRYNSEVRALR